jgi:hypothetical protein
MVDTNGWEAWHILYRCLVCRRGSNRSITNKPHPFTTMILWRVFFNTDALVLGLLLAHDLICYMSYHQRRTFIH